MNYLNFQNPSKCKAVENVELEGRDGEDLDQSNSSDESEELVESSIEPSL